MNTSHSLTRREEKLGAAALVVATFAVLAWGQLAPLVSSIRVNSIVPGAILESRPAEIRPAARKVDPQQLQSRTWTKSPASA